MIKIKCAPSRARLLNQWAPHRSAIPYRSFATLKPPEATQEPTPPPPNQEPSPSPQPPKRPISIRPYIYATGFLLLGLTAGQFFRLTAVPPPLPIPNSPDDILFLQKLSSDADQLPIVKELRSKPSVWKEWNAYSSFTPAEKERRFSSGPMGGSRGLGVQRIFWNQAEKKAISVIFFGGALSGWPGVTHGGAIATVMDESLGRVAIMGFPAKTGVTANLDLNYRSPTQANGFYVLKVEPVPESCTERKALVKGTLETIHGRVCVEATGLFVVPKGFKPGEIREGF
ncbi:MAG: hypothetical protein M1812_002351 [Candelaria pacifica]|nr:MAG: hypothetical protein M1812_002351 [Candelaria pacifica]